PHPSRSRNRAPSCRNQPSSRPYAPRYESASPSTTATAAPSSTNPPTPSAHPSCSSAHSATYTCYSSSTSPYPSASDSATQNHQPEPCETYGLAAGCSCWTPTVPAPPPPPGPPPVPPPPPPTHDTVGAEKTSCNAPRIFPEATSPPAECTTSLSPDTINVSWP